MGTETQGANPLVSPLAVTQEEACMLLSCGPTKLSELREKGYLLPLWKGVYAVKDIEACVEKLREERDGRVLDLTPRLENEGIPKKERTLRGEVGRPKYRTSEKLLRGNG
jgi:hypothetical protein